MILEDCIARIIREKYFNYLEDYILHQLLNNNNCRLRDLATGRNLRVKTPCSHKTIHKVTWNSCGFHVKLIDHVLVNARFNNSILDVKPIRGAESDSDDF